MVIRDGEWFSLASIIISSLSSISEAFMVEPLQHTSGILALETQRISGVPTGYKAEEVVGVKYLDSQ